MTQLSIQQAFDLALEHHRAGRLHDAEHIYRQILVQQPKHVDALHHLGVIAHQAGRHDVAVDLIQQAIALMPNNPGACCNLGLALKALGHLQDTIAAYRQAIALKPDFAEAHNNLAIALKESGQLEEAILACRKAISIAPRFAEAHNNLGTSLFEKGLLDEAIAAYTQAIDLKPDYAEAYNNLGAALIDKGQLPQALAACRQSLALNPNYAEPHYNLGNALKDDFRFDEAIESYRRAISLGPRHAQAHANLGNVLKAIGHVDEAMAAYRQALAINPKLIIVDDNILFTMHYRSEFDPQTIAHEHRLWTRRHAQPFMENIRPHLNDPNPDRRLRVGYVSPDFRRHAVTCFLFPLLSNHDQRNVEVFAYAQVRKPDSTTEQLRGLTSAWRSLVGLTDAQAAALIRQDQIDILVDLAGHTAGNRLLVFAQKPAPVQLTYLGYPDTTGLPTIDYRVTDSYADPPGQSESLCSERLFRISPCAWCFQPGSNVPISQRAPGPITFGCFNNFVKVTESMLQLWGRILHAVPGSRLLMKAEALGSAAARDSAKQIFNGMGISPQRLDLRGFERTYGGHLALYGQMDIALDTFPYHGATTTCEALWMGVPVVTLAGSSHVSRVGVSLLTNVGLPELIAGSEEQYVQIAVSLANDIPRLNELRNTLRPRMEQSPLMDGPKFARTIETAYQQMWRTWCRRASSNT